MNKMAIQARDIKKSYFTGPEELLIFEETNLNIEEEKIYALYGSSGSGKSTLLHLISGLDKPDEGEITIEGTSIHHFKEDEAAIFRRKHIGFVFQFHHLLVDFTAVENIMVPLMLMNNNIKTCQERAQDLLSLVGLSNRHEHKPAELSGGERQRVAIARALANEPSIILADEPTGNLDKGHSDKILELIKKLNSQLKTTFLIATHDLEISKIADYKMEIVNKQVEEI